ncbi:MAG TPA: hypothetical protein VKQ72_21455 [Aggregatilineales bacterium]|nr:hypothetical protein [Aggregatilineales bacterium]
MTIIEVLGRVNENGDVEFEQPGDLPPGDVRIIIETIDIAADEALWDDQFARSQDWLRQMALKAIQEDDAGLTEDFDPDNDPDAP